MNGRMGDDLIEVKKETNSYFCVPGIPTTNRNNNSIEKIDKI